MALPTKLVAWNFQLQTRITYASLVQVARETMFLIKQRLVAQGWTVKGSSDGSSANMTGTDTWITAANAGVRGANATTAQSWIVLRDANNYDVLFAYVSATDDVYGVFVDFEGNYAAAGTPTFTPTSATGLALNTFYTTTPGTIIGSGTSLDRVVSVWTRPDSKGFRVAIARSGAFTSIFGVDTHAPVTYGAGITVASEHGFYANAPGAISQAVWVAAQVSTILAANAQFRIVSRRMSNANLDCAKTLEAYGAPISSVSFTTDEAHQYAPELQGGSEYIMVRIGINSQTTSHRGKVGNLMDWWFGRTLITDGDTYGNREFIVVAGNAGWVWDWDGTPSVPGTAVTMS